MAITPQAVDFYSRYMDALFDEKDIIGVTTVWQQFFGKPAHGNSKTIYSPNSEVVEIDIMRANERIAAMVHRGIDSRMLNLQKNSATQNFSTFSRVYPLCEELGDITASQINKRVAGENPYEAMPREARIRMLAREHHLEHIRRYVRLFEGLAGLSLLGGQMPAILGSNNADNWYDFRRNAAQIVAPTVPWDAPGADILGDIDDACRILRENGKVKPNVMFFGQNVSRVFMADATIQALADISGFNFIRFGESGFNMPANLNELVAAGANPMGMLFTPEGNLIWCFTYVDVYTDDNGDAQHYMPLNSVFIAYYGARCDRYFGPPERLPLTSADAAWYQEMFGMNINAPMLPANIKGGGGVVNPAMFYCDAYRSGDNKKVTVRTQSAPIFATTQTDAFFTYYSVLTRSS
jgi:hypothetical protein